MLLQVLHRAWSSPFTTRSDYARQDADAIAEASCRGLITTFNHETQSWGRTWRITAAGARLLEENTQC